jgi:hypothetical protein
MHLEMLANQMALVSAFALTALCVMYICGCMTNARYYLFMRNGTLIRERSESSEI